MTKHLQDRVGERLRGVVENPARIVEASMNYTHSRGPHRSVAMLVAVLPQACGAAKKEDINFMAGQYFGRPSNGNEVWVIARNCRLVTVMFRRPAQPKKAMAFDVHEVVDLTKVLSGGQARVINQRDSFTFRMPSRAA